MRITACWTTLLALSAPAFSQLQFKPLATINLDSTANNANPEFVGSNPSAVAWDNDDLIVAGFNGTGAATNTGIVRVSNVFTTPSISAAFGVASTPATRGYSGIAAQSGNIAAAFDNGANSANGLALYDSVGALLWQVNTFNASPNNAYRGFGGTDFDPGFVSGGGVDAGVSALTTGSGRRALMNASTGLWTYTQSTGAIINVSPTATNWRDHAYDPATGDLYTRVNNDVAKHTRTGGNTFAPNVRIVDVTDATAVAGQNIEFLNTALGNFLIYNDRPSTATQPLTTAVKIIDTSGVAQIYNLGPGFSAANSGGYYDFSWDAANARLALLDFGNRRVYVFELCSGVDTDSDGVVDCIDNCVALANPLQEDCDNDGSGDACELAGGALDTNANLIPDECELGVVIAYCTAGVSSNGCTPTLNASGTPSAAAASGFTLNAGNLEGQRTALAFYGVGGPQAVPFGGGSSFKCVASQLRRMTRIDSGGTLGACDGSYSIDFLAFIASNPTTLGTPFASGDIVNAQVWYRDPGAPATTNLTSALQWTMQP